MGRFREKKWRAFLQALPHYSKWDSVPACLQCTCSWCGWLVQCAPDRTQALIYALLCLLLSRIQAKEVGPCLGSIERYDRAGRINIVPDFIFSAHKPACGTGQARCGAGPAPEGMVIYPPCDWLAQSPLNQGVRCYRELYMPLSSDNTETISLFLTEEWLVWLWGRCSRSQNFSYVQFICFSSFVRQPVVSSKLAAFRWSVLRQYEQFMLFCLNEFKILQKVVFQPLHRPHAHVAMPLQIWLVYSSLDSTADCRVNRIQSSLQSQPCSSLYTDNLCPDSFAAFPFVIFFHTRHVPFLHGGSILTE